jgi:hypothetical protein
MDSSCNKRYLNFDEGIGYPKGKNIYYECGICGDVIISIPEESTQCSCRNVHIDIDYGRVSVREPDKFRVFECVNRRN